MKNTYEVTEDIIFYAFRYALGRMTYSVNDVATCIIENWNLLTKNTKDLIIKEIKQAITENRAGMECDINRWKDVLKLGEQNGRFI